MCAQKLPALLVFLAAETADIAPNLFPFGLYSMLSCSMLDDTQFAGMCHLSA